MASYKEILSAMENTYPIYADSSHVKSMKLLLISPLLLQAISSTFLLGFNRSS